MLVPNIFIICPLSWQHKDTVVTTENMTKFDGSSSCLLNLLTESSLVVFLQKKGHSAMSVSMTNSFHPRTHISVHIYLFIYSLFNNAVSNLVINDFGGREIHVFGLRECQPCTLVTRSQHFRGRCCLHYHG